MSRTPTTLSTPALKKVIDHYYKQLQAYKGRADYELAIRTAVLNLLNETGREKALADFQRALADVLDWNIAKYNNGTVLIHT
jgi:hypothetical protein